MGFEITTSSADETLAVAETIGKVLPPGCVVLLRGELGAGKTVFAKGLGKGLGVKEEITSPSFNLMLRYKGHVSFDHWDLYRIARIDEDAEFLESVYDPSTVCAIEWAEHLSEIPNVPILGVSIQPDSENPEMRRITFSGDESLLNSINQQLKNWGNV